MLKIGEGGGSDGCIPTQGIEIFDCNWKKPKGYILIKRAFLMLTVGYVICYKSFFVDKDNFRIFDYERETLGTYVIDKKVFMC